MAPGTDGPLSAAQQRTVAALGEVLLPSGGAFPLGANDVELARHMNRLLAQFSPFLATQIGHLFTLSEYAPLASRYRSRLSRLSPAERSAYVEAALHSSMPWRRLPAELVRQLCGFVFCALPEVETALAFTHGCVAQQAPQPGPRLTPVQYPEIAGDLDVKVDVCIIGSGAGGAVIAKELAQAGARVAVLEEGAYFTSEDFDGPPFERILRTYRDQGTTMALGWPPIPLPLGKAVGGTTVINSGTCFRAPDTVLQRWESEHGLEGYDARSLAPIFDQVEQILNVVPVPWDIIGKNAEVFDRGVKALGLRGEPIRRNIRGCRGCGVCAFGCPSDAKQAMHLSYLPLAERAGARIYSRCRAERLRWSGKRVSGIDAVILDSHSEEIRGRLRIDAERVVVAAGAIHTPLFLRANRVARGNRHLGRNLRLHPAMSVSATMPHDVHGWRGTLQSYFVDHLMASHEVMIEVTSPMPSVAVNITKAFGASGKQDLADYHRRAAAGLFVSDSSSGSVHGRAALPIIFYRLNRRDTDRLLVGMALTAEIFLAAGASKVHLGLPGLASVSSRQELAQLRDSGRWKPHALQPTAFHPMGTCRMGRDATQSVVRPDGQVHQVEGLYVADGSLFPSCVGVNPQETIMAFATRIAQQMMR